MAKYKLERRPTTTITIFKDMHEVLKLYAASKELQIRDATERLLIIALRAEYEEIDD